MIAKVSLTTYCNGRCVTCPVWHYEGQHMSVETWREAWWKLNESPTMTKIILNNTGDVGVHPHRKELFDIMREGKKKWIVLQTNAAVLPDLPPNLDELIVSFNGGTKEAYEATTGLNFKQVVENVRALYPQISSLRNAEVHCLIWEKNKGTEKALIELWKDFPGHVRFSYKYDNQHAQDFTLPQFKRKTRIVCDYLDMLSVWPDGSIVMCAHDFKGEVRWGSLLESTPEQLITHRYRQAKRVEHFCDEFNGLCADCNYNIPVTDQTRYVR